MLSTFFYNKKIPELSEMGLEIEKHYMKDFKEEVHRSTLSLERQESTKFAFKIKIINFMLQNLGMIIGFSCMLILAIYAKKISL
jgi:hypothetical protein